MSKTMKPVQIIQNLPEHSAEIYIFGDIVASQWYDDETSPDSFRRQLQRLHAEGVTDLNVHVDSYGGAISAGWAIYNVLKDWPGTISTFADGFVASAAVYPFLAGKNRYANPMSAFFLHQAWTVADGNADELRKAADDIEKFNAIGLEAFAAAGMDKDRILELEKQETWLNASEALELGLATEILDRSENQDAQQSVRARIVQALTGADIMTVNEHRSKLGLEPIREDGDTPHQILEKPAGEAGHEERETNPAAGNGAGEVKTNHLMAFLTRHTTKE